MVSRNQSIELYRIILMFGICLLHAVGVEWGGDPYSRHQWGMPLQFCVDGFVLISGYFGIRFSWRKVFKLCLTGAYAAFVSTAVCRLYDGVGFSGYVTESYRVYCEYWFLHAYVVLMMLAPLINGWLESCMTWKQSLKSAGPLFVLIFGWSFIYRSRLLGFNCPISDGLGDQSALVLLACYVAGRIYQKFGVSKYIRPRYSLLALAVAAVFSLGGYGYNNSLLCLVMALSSFSLLERVRITPRIGRVIAWVAPSMFAVYLIHSTARGFVVLSQLRVFFVTQGFPLLLTWFFVAVVLFVGSLILDIPRRVVAK